MKTSPGRDPEAINLIPNVIYNNDIRFPTGGLSTREIEEHIDTNENAMNLYLSIPRGLLLGDGMARQDGGRYVIPVPEMYIPDEDIIERERLMHIEAIINQRCIDKIRELGRKDELYTQLLTQ